MEIRGTVKQVYEPVAINTKNGTKNKTTFVLWLTDPAAQYPQTIALETFNDEVARFVREYPVNMAIVVKCDVYAREHMGKVYNSFNAWNAHAPEQ